MAEMTDWFDGDVKPVRKGVYERHMPYPDKYSYWTGQYWGLSGRSVAQASEEFSLDRESAAQTALWRGLAADPKKGGK